MKNNGEPNSKLARLNHYIQNLCGLYSRVARRFNVDRSYVSRVARGERRSENIERALVSEFVQATEEQERPTPEQNQ